MAKDPVASVEETLRLGGPRREQVIRELRSHIQASRHDLELSGRSPADAEVESIRRFGDPAEVAEMLTVVHRRKRPRVQSLVIAFAALVGLSAWLGTSHTLASSVHRRSPTATTQQAPRYVPAADALARSAARLVVELGLDGR